MTIPPAPGGVLTGFNGGGNGLAPGRDLLNKANSPLAVLELGFGASSL